MEMFKKLKHNNYQTLTSLVGGFPCQSFSIAGSKKGFNDTRGSLFFEIARILKNKKPRHFILENVKGILSNDKGRTFQTILKVLSNLGYIIEWQVLNSKNFGVPQNRERVYFVGHLRGKSKPKVFSFRKNTEKSNQKNHPKELTKNVGQGQRVYSTNGASVSIKAGGGGQGGKTGLYQVGVITRNGKVIHKDTASCLDANYFKGFDNYGNRTGVKVKEATTKGYAIARKGDSINLSVPNSKTRRGRVGKQIAQTLDTATQQYTIDKTQIRRLTPIECERLQGFPDNWTEGLSDTQRYKCLGNAVTTNVIEWIGKQLYEC